MPKPRDLTSEQLAATRARREQFSAMVKTVAKMTDAERTALAQKCMAVNTEGKMLSLTNQMLIAIQRPGATVVGGFAQWLKQKRCVRKGEHGIAIWVPKTLPTDKAIADPEKDVRLAFFMGTVFDISQTEEQNA